MTDKRLQLIADVKDSATPKLRRLGEEMKRSLRRTPAMDGMTKWFQEFNRSSKDFVTQGAKMSDAIGAFGIGSIAAGAGLAGLIESFKELGQHILSVKELGRETGLTIDQVRRWEYVGKNFGVTTDQMDSALSKFGDTWVGIATKTGQAYNDLVHMPGGDALVNKLLGDSSTEQRFKDYLSFLAKIKAEGSVPAAQIQKLVADEFGSSNLISLFRDGPKALQQAMSDAQKNVMPVTKQMLDESRQLAAETNRLEQSWQNIELTIGGPILKDLNEVLTEVQKISDWVPSFLKDPLGATKKSVGNWLHSQADDKSLDKKAWINLPKDALAASRTIENSRSIMMPTFKDLEKSNPPKMPPVTKWPSPLPKPGDFGVGGAGASPMSFEGPTSGLLHLMAYRPPAAGQSLQMDSSTDNPLRAGVRQGVLDAFREWQAENDVSGGKYTAADYQVGGGAGLPFAPGSRTVAGLAAHARAFRGGAPGAPWSKAAGGLAGRGAPDYGHYSGSGGPGPGGSVQTRAMQMMDRLTKKWGFSPASAAIFAGGDMQESSLNPRASGDPQVPGGSHGLGQWNRERLDALKRFAGKNWESLNAQTDFQAQEILKSHPDWAHQKSLAAGPGIEKSYEGYRTGYAGRRTEYAGQFYRDYERSGSLHDEARKAGLPPKVHVEGGIEAHIHVHGAAKALHAKQPTGMISAVNLVRMPTMTEPDYEA